MEEVNVNVIVRIHPSKLPDDSTLTYDSTSIKVTREAKKVTSEYTFSSILGC